MHTSDKIYPKYKPSNFESKWVKEWQIADLFQNIAGTEIKDRGSIIYLLYAFAYPSGSGLHVGHVEPQTALDILARYYRMIGKKVFFPVGWDAFGLPAENYAVKTGVHPSITTKKAIRNFKKQVKRIGISYDWCTELSTCDTNYYKWTQWIFLELLKKGLAYKKKASANWCPSCQTVLANEQVIKKTIKCMDLQVCERCESEVLQKKLDQWFFKITKYKDELLKDLEKVDWPQATKEQQRNWIGRKEGININYKLKNIDHSITCFTTRPETNFGATFIVLAPEHDLIKSIIKGKYDDVISNGVKAKIIKYVEQYKKKTGEERMLERRNKSGVDTTLKAINILNSKDMPIWASDFVLSTFGTGAVVGVPGHDKRDFEFAKKFELPVVRVVSENARRGPIVSIDEVQENQGVIINSDFLNGLNVSEAKDVIIDYIEKIGCGKRAISYNLRDWGISRQRYWGAPIPIVYDREGVAHPVKEEHLPWKLPEDVVDFIPKGQPPLEQSIELKERTERLYGKGWRPEYETMDTFVDSSWYYLRYVDVNNNDTFASKERINSFLPVDFYMIGAEHIVLHLLYSRFFTKFLRDNKYLSFDEPFKKMRHQGMILGPDGKKMSKSKGNVITPDEVIKKYGADTLRVYEMFMGPIDSDKPWNELSVQGVYRFLTRVWSLVIPYMNQKGVNSKAKDVVEDDTPRYDTRS